LLAVSALGLGACWLGVHPRAERISHITKALGLPAPHVLPVAVIALGWPAETHAPRTRYRESSVHYESW